jgi:D-glycero-alpha-D-manno-heptose 1-phosphate guanylyltransferase
MEVVKQAIVLAGGLGTRLQAEVPDLPKSMAPVAGRPFLSFVIDALRMQGIERFVFSLGYRSEAIEAYLEKDYSTLEYVTVIEDEPLGTGGAIKLALQKASAEDVLVTNGDTLFRIELQELASVHLSNGAECTLALKPLKNFDRYGVVTINGSGAVQSFREKQFYAEGLINGGTYIINRERFLKRSLPSKFSIEKDYLENEVGSGFFFGSVQQGYFIDIGVPEDYKKANKDLARTELDLKNIDGTWTLFLDRDGVINLERFERYILHWGEFQFLDGVLDSFKKLNNKFKRILIVSNQRGVTKNLMSEDDLKDVHHNMLQAIEENGGSIERIYYCIEKADSCFFRKPNPGMALKAKKDFPDINFSKSVMVGNKPSDMRFGRAAGMFTVFVTTTNPDQPFPHPDIDMRFESLAAFAEALES